MPRSDRLPSNDPQLRRIIDAVVESDAIHQWYQIIMGFDWKLVRHLIDRLEIGQNHLVLDPFCGAGTTLVQCKKQGIQSVGIDANPVCTLASIVKTAWGVHPDKLRILLDDVLAEFDDVLDSDALTNDEALAYLRESGMIERGWISLHKATKVLALNESIERVEMSAAERRFFHLGLMSAVVDRIADIKFGPELYCLKTPKRSQVVSNFVECIDIMIDDVASVRRNYSKVAPSHVHLGDSRQREVLKRAVGSGADFLITSPPYPAEHDYTRSTRLELVMLGHIRATRDLRPLKQRMVRCHTKGIYKTDADARHVSRYGAVQEIARKLNWRARGHSDGFSKLYGRMVQEYFGGMICHLRQMHEMLKPGAKCAYVSWRHLALKDSSLMKLSNGSAQKVQRAREC
jgi:DNA methylase